ncbi:glycerol-3-phosphate dehydrogenase [Legionella birminghamensis]|uniref:Glycerol-3-phosphate dehydrogenase n=1 Tax=Legionella birminghamensis TaxID=28083 RepID=A0A378I874_9GAMM|nr:glycerol-3-phosphate dehydrogenase [Legionella birminghamensis]KTC67874.1 glycerol-3-phosphate dehydrogenase [Legionella birminghamensis]STX31417.1 glycerol-3-phosphate dehydrogenase [Legionella birminghamensis]
MVKGYDVAVIGGGINGCGIAADAAERGLSVILLEKDDIGSKTSSNSSKLIHGGLRYLEYYDFSLVKKALDERQLLLSLAPHLVYPTSFVLPYLQSMRPTWLLRTGLFLYDNLSRKNKLPRSRLIKRNKSPDYFRALNPEFSKGFLFSDCTTDDSRLTLVNALLAKEYGAAILPNTELIAAETHNNQWMLRTRNKSQQVETVNAKVVINAAGPWVEPLNNLLGIESYYKISMVQGSHFVVHKLYEGDHAYLLQNTDNRIVFVIPYHGHTMIGTTDVPFSGDLDHVAISPLEINYLFQLIRGYFKHHLTHGDIINTWSGVRPLLFKPGESPQALSRDYLFHLNQSPAPVITIYGGKITTYRQLACEAIDQLKPVFPRLQPASSAKIALPGAVLDSMSFNEYQFHAKEIYHWLNPTILNRYLRSYGTRTEFILADCKKMTDLGENIGHGLYTKEIDYLMGQEWASCAEDILWRRTKLGLELSVQEKVKLENYCRQHGG